MMLGSFEETAKFLYVKDSLPIEVTTSSYVAPTISSFLSTVLRGRVNFRLNSTSPSTQGSEDEGEEDSSKATDTSSGARMAIYTDEELAEIEAEEAEQEEEEDDIDYDDYDEYYDDEN